MNAKRFIAVQVFYASVLNTSARNIAYSLDRLWKTVRNSEFNARNGRCSIFRFCTSASAKEAAEYAYFNIAAFLAADRKGNVKFYPANQIATINTAGDGHININGRIYPTAKAFNFFVGFYRSFNDARKGS